MAEGRGRVAAGRGKGKGSAVEILECRGREREERMMARIVYTLIPCCNKKTPRRLSLLEKSHLNI